MEGAPPVANQIDLFMHFLGASRDGLVARRVDLDTISSSDCKFIICGAISNDDLALWCCQWLHRVQFMFVFENP
jgi:hypothetical protein